MTETVYVSLLTRIILWGLSMFKIDYWLQRYFIKKLIQCEQFDNTYTKIHVDKETGERYIGWFDSSRSLQQRNILHTKSFPMLSIKAEIEKYFMFNNGLTGQHILKGRECRMLHSMVEDFISEFKPKPTFFRNLVLGSIIRKNYFLTEEFADRVCVELILKIEARFWELKTVVNE